MFKFFMFSIFVFLPTYSFIKENENMNDVFKNKVNLIYMLYFIVFPFMAKRILESITEFINLNFFPVFILVIILLSLILFKFDNNINKYRSNIILLLFIVVESILAFIIKLFNDGSGHGAYTTFYLMLCVWGLGLLCSFFYLGKTIIMLYKRSKK